MMDVDNDSLYIIEVTCIHALTPNKKFSCISDKVLNSKSSLVPFPCDLKREGLFPSVPHSHLMMSSLWLI